MYTALYCLGSGGKHVLTRQITAVPQKEDSEESGEQIINRMMAKLGGGRDDGSI